jgi:uncharacterized protein (TIGR03435 family)
MNKRRSNRPKPLPAVFSLAEVLGIVVLGLVDSGQIAAQSPPRTAAVRPSFEAATIIPSPHRGAEVYISNWGKFTVTSVTAKYLIEYAYNDGQAGDVLSDDRLVGGPGWINFERYDVDAKVEDSLAEKLRNLPAGQVQDQIRLMVQSLLADQFNLRVHYERKEHPVYALVVAKGGPKFLQTKLAPGGADPHLEGAGGTPLLASAAGRQRIWIHGSMGQLAMALARNPDVGRAVVDQTGITGDYDCGIEWGPDRGPEATHRDRVAEANAGLAKPDSQSPPDASEPTIFRALQDQLGLKLEPETGPLDVIVIDYIERPSEN